MSNRIKANGIEINYRFDGPEGAPLVVLSNSLASDMHMWDWQLDALTERYRTLRYDTRGHGGSEVPPGDYTIADLTADLHGLMQALETGPAHIVGLSLGGSTAQSLALEHPGMVRSLALCDTTSRSPGPKMWQERAQAVREGGMDAVVDSTVDRWLTPSFQETDAAEVERIRQMILRTPPEGFAGCCNALAYLDLTDRLSAIEAPTIVIVGEDDPGTPVAAAEAIHRQIGGSRLVILQQAAHFSNVEQQRQFNSALRDFLDQVESGS